MVPQFGGPWPDPGSNPNLAWARWSRNCRRLQIGTLHRSLAISLCNIFVMVALLLFGGASIKQFIAVMLIGLVSGTYSSIFNAVPLVVAWAERDIWGTKNKTATA